MEIINAFIERAEQGDTMRVLNMINSGIITDVDVQNENGETALGWAVSNGHMNMVDKLVRSDHSFIHSIFIHSPSHRAIDKCIDV